MNWSLVIVCLVFAATTLSQSFPRVRIFNPKEGDIWYSGDIRTVIWRRAYIPPPAYPTTVNITLRRYNSSFRLPLAVNHPNNGRFSFKVPVIPSGDNYQVRIIPNRPINPSAPNIIASRSRPFGIYQRGSLEITAPSDGDVWYGGQRRNIRFTPVSGDVKIIISNEKFIPVPIEIITAGDSGVYQWRVPFELRTSADYKIQVISESGADDVTIKIVQVGDASGTQTVTIVLPTETP